MTLRLLLLLLGLLLGLEVGCIGVFVPSARAFSVFFCGFDLERRSEPAFLWMRVALSVAGSSGWVDVIGR